MKCYLCGTHFDQEEAENSFEYEYTIYSYSNFIKPLCGDCAVSVIKDEIEGFYFEECEKCGNRFDLIKDSDEFSQHENGVHLIDCWDNDILCCDCALDAMDELFPVQ